MSLSKRLVAALLLAMAIVVTTGMLAVHARKRLVASSRLVTQTHEILEGLDALLADMVDAETGQRGFVITGEESYLEPSRLAIDRIADDIGRLDALIKDERVHAYLDGLVSLVEQKLAVSREIVGLRRSGGFEAAAAAVRTNRGKNAMDSIRRTVAEMSGRERELLAERTTLAEAEAGFADISFLGGSLVSGLMIGWIFFLLRREVRGRQASEVELRRHGAISDGILSSMVDGVIVADLHGAILMMNPTAEQMLGRFRHAGSGFESAWPVVFRPDGVTPYPPEEVPLARALRGETVDGVECMALLPSRKEPVWFSVSARPLVAGDGAHLGGVSVFRDVTEAKRAEIALQHTNDNLRDSVEELEQRNQEVTLLGELSGLLQACLSEDEASGIIAQSLGRLFPASGGAIYLLNPSHNLVFARATWGDPPPRQQTFGPDDCWSLRRGRTHTLDTHRLGLRCAHVDGAVTSCVCVPLMAQGDALGVLHVERRTEAGAAGARAAPRLLHAVADEIGLALANLRLRDSLRQQSIRDPLTNLFNRRYMEESLERELQRAKRKRTSLGVLMIDVDHFKGFNDSFGHDAGDALLCALGAMLKSSIRGEDLACRYGGEELVVILPGASAEDSMQRAELLRTRAKGIVVHHNDRTLRTVTLSIGVAVFPDCGADGKSLVQIADRALYRAKHDGRDRVVFASAAALAAPDAAA